MKLPYVVYRDAITADNMIQVVAVCTEEKGGNLLVQTVTTLRNPALLIRCTKYETKSEDYNSVRDDPTQRR
ncbi:hypothetical protein AB205_0133340 [Aquarana catesbeiana]|uniref:Uncharacterized protein n=1 Tax=Aquarana catesbeiana TaxID=8400 RepID=A0A2G9RV40_AQUCT|nr:hypothetical protein AB205_0133340 [Aquarana catesbeiana]